MSRYDYVSSPNDLKAAILELDARFNNLIEERVSGIYAALADHVERIAALEGWAPAESKDGPEHADDHGNTV